MILLFLSLALAQQPEPAPPTPEPVVVAMPEIATYVEAPYPAEALEGGLEAKVKLKIELSDAGEVLSVEVVEPAGHGFDEAAVDAVLAMKWVPARTEIGPIAVVFEFTYGFELAAPEPVPEAPKAVNFEGTVREMGTGAPIAGVTVAVGDLIGTTDEAGHFEVRGVPAGEVPVRLLHTGHVTETRTLAFVEGELTEAKLWLRSESYRENELVAVYAPPKEEVTRRTLTIEEVRRIPGTFGDPVKVVQTLPGAARSPFGTGLLVIRGSNPEDSGVYIDGIRIPLIYHLTGTTSVIAPDLVEAVDYLPGGYGVQYGRSMGGVVDVRTRRAFSDQPKLIWGTDILDSNVYFEGKIGKEGKKHGVAIGVRRSYIEALLPLFITGDYVFKPRYWDYQVKWVLPTEADRNTSLFVYGFDDVLTIGTPDDVAQGSDQDTQGDLRTQYNSHRVIFQVERDLSESLTLRFTPALGRDTTYFGLGSEFLLDNQNVLGQIRSELAWEATPAVEVVPGIDFLGAWWAFNFESAVRFDNFDDPLSEREPVGFDGHGTIWSPDPFLRINLRPLDDRDKWLITPGIRGNIVTTVTSGTITGTDEALPPSTILAVDPRLATRYQLSDPLTVKGVVGLYHQPPQPQEIIGVGTESNVTYERALTSSIGLEHRISPAIHYDLEVFYKDMRDLLIFDEAWTGFGSNPYLNGGDGRAYGLEVILRHEPVNRLFGWVSYTLSHASRRDSDTCADVGVEPDTGASGDLFGYGPCWYRFDFDQTHILSAQAGYDLPHDFGVSAQVQYVTGNPTTYQDTGVYDADGAFYVGFSVQDYNDARLPAYFQTSVRFDKLFTFKRWQLETYVDLLNVVRGVNPELTLFAYDYSEYAYVRGLPFIPNVGVEAKFWP